jgi:hypothetical protein
MRLGKRAQRMAGAALKNRRHEKTHAPISRIDFGAWGLRSISAADAVRLPAASQTEEESVESSHSDCIRWLKKLMSRQFPP